jgi:hypothetical protein
MTILTSTFSRVRSSVVSKAERRMGDTMSSGFFLDQQAGDDDRVRNSSCDQITLAPKVRLLHNEYSLARELILAYSFLRVASTESVTEGCSCNAAFLAPGNQSATTKIIEKREERRAFKVSIFRHLLLQHGFEKEEQEQTQRRMGCGIERS